MAHDALPSLWAGERKLVWRHSNDVAVLLVQFGLNVMVATAQGHANIWERRNGPKCRARELSKRMGEDIVGGFAQQPDHLGLQWSAPLSQKRRRVTLL